MLARGFSVENSGQLDLGERVLTNPGPMASCCRGQSQPSRVQPDLLDFACLRRARLRALLHLPASGLWSSALWGLASGAVTSFSLNPRAQALEHRPGLRARLPLPLYTAEPECPEVPTRAGAALLGSPCWGKSSSVLLRRAQASSGRRSLGRPAVCLPRI